MKIKIKAKKAKTMVNGTAIFKDFDKNTYTIRPAIIQNIAVLVPEANIPHITAIAIEKKKILTE